MATEIPKKDPLRNSALKKCFQALVDRKQVNINMDILKTMLKHELLVNLDDLDLQLSSVLPYMLIVYMRNWPGWQKSKEYYSGKLNFRDWFVKFRQYIIVRLRVIIKNGYEEVIRELKADRGEVDTQSNEIKSSKNRGTQTDYLAPKGDAPFCISIECSPKIMTSLVFMDRNDSVILGHHLETYKKSKPSFRELLNWPYVGVEFWSHEMYFKRYNRCEQKRFITLGIHKPTVEKQSLIEEIKIVNPNDVQKCFSLNLIWAYSYQYMQILRECGKINSERLDNIEIVLEEFLKDVNEWKLNNSIATNTSVLFNIGNSSFTRSKRVSRTKSAHTTTLPEITYSEIFIPKMETELKYFKGEQASTTTDVSFIYLNSLKKKLESQIDPEAQVPILVFICLFCNSIFNCHEDLSKHLEGEHGAEPNLICIKCQKSSTVCSLAKNRWKDDCCNRN